MDTSTTTAPVQTDDEILAAFEADSRARADARAAEIKASIVAAVKKLNELREKEPAGDFLIAGDDGGPFRGVFRAPTADIWKIFQRELRSEEQRPLAGQNLAVRCIVWPGPQELAMAQARRPALYNVLSGVLAAEAGSGQEGYVKK